MLYPTELRAQYINQRSLSQNMSICFLYSIYISRNLSVKRQMSDTNKSTFDNYNSYDSFSCEKCLSQMIPKVVVCKSWSARPADSHSLQQGVSKHAFLNLNPSDQPVHLCLFRTLYSAVKFKDLHSQPRSKHFENLSI